MDISPILKKRVRAHTKQLGITQKEYVERALVTFSLLTTLEVELQTELTSWQQASAAGVSDFFTSHDL